MPATETDYERGVLDAFASQCSRQDVKREFAAIIASENGLISWDRIKELGLSVFDDKKEGA